MRRAALAAVLGAAALGWPLLSAQTLKPTDHPPVPSAPERVWFVPRAATPGPLADAASLIDEEQYAKALDLLTHPRAEYRSLAGYAAYLAGRAHLALEHAEQARDAFRAALATHPVGYLAEAAQLAEADAEEALANPSAAFAIYTALVGEEDAFERPAILLRQANAAVEMGDRDAAVRIYQQLYYEYPLSEPGAAAAAALKQMGEEPAIEAGSNGFARELRRAEQLFSGRRYAAARDSFQRIQTAAAGDTRELIDLRIAETDYFSRRYRNARDVTRRYMDRGSRRSEAAYYWALSVKALGATNAYVSTLQRIAEGQPESTFVEDALNELGSHYIVEDEDERADTVFRHLYAAFPTGRYAERAAWKAGWWAFRHGRYQDTIRTFEQVAADFPRSDYRPSWLYWLGRSYEARHETTRAQARYALVVADYRNTYYGRLASARLDDNAAVRRIALDRSSDVVVAPPNIGLVRDLLAAGLFSQAIDELRYARAVWGDSVPLQATLAWALNRHGDLRPAINLMKRAYPQYMAAGGEQLPRDVLTILFPLDYWPLIRKHAEARRLDPYLLAALVAQESTFDARIRSSANAYGLMQLLPATARRYAPRVGLRYSSRLLTDPESNIRLGTAYFADLVQEFGDVSLALAGYNAGELRVRAWRAERPGLAGEEFIDDIPFPETQNYVRRILGTADDYRLLYGSSH